MAVEVVEDRLKSMVGAAEARIQPRSVGASRLGRCCSSGAHAPPACAPCMLRPGQLREHPGPPPGALPTAGWGPGRGPHRHARLYKHMRTCLPLFPSRHLLSCYWLSLGRDAERLSHRAVFKNGDMHMGVFVLHSGCAPVPWRDSHSVVNLRVLSVDRGMIRANGVGKLDAGRPWGGGPPRAPALCVVPQAECLCVGLWPSALFSFVSAHDSVWAFCPVRPPQGILS